MATEDEKPETETPPETPPTPPENPPAPPPKKDEGEIPEWGKDLSTKVESLLEALKPPMPADGDPIEDKTPVRRPWHKRGFFGGE